MGAVCYRRVLPPLHTAVRPARPPHTGSPQPRHRGQ